MFFKVISGFAPELLAISKLRLAFTINIYFKYCNIQTDSFFLQEKSS